jgi:hypothetical protein
MLVGDSNYIDRRDRGNKQESHQDQIRKWVQEQTANAVYLDNHDLSPANAERQLGQTMFAADLERRLKKINPNLIFETNPFNTSKKALYHVRPDATKVFICAYENGVMPEHSIFRVKEEEVLRPEFVNPFKRHLDRKDLPKFEHKQDGSPLGKIVFDDMVEKPGFRKVKLPWGESVRGWRTVTIRLVAAKLATPAEVERVFGSSNRPEWARHMGKKDIYLPW